uniref:Uncharacterized protein n=1 Tax=Solanum tuberosum TaxID=4113 RepID=M1CGL4_SOLTU
MDPKYGPYTRVYIRCIHRLLEEKWGQSPKKSAAFGPMFWAATGPKGPNYFLFLLF